MPDREDFSRKASGVATRDKWPLYVARDARHVDAGKPACPWCGDAWIAHDESVMECVTALIEEGYVKPRPEAVRAARIGGYVDGEGRVRNRFGRPAHA